MSRSLNRVRAALEAVGLVPELREMGETRTARQAADAVGCALDQIVKSIVFWGEDSDHLVLFLTAGGNRVCPERASAAAGQPLGRADAARVRAETGFAIGGVAPVGHLRPPRIFWDPRLDAFETVWAAAGTPRHVFAIAPADLRRITGATPADFVLAP
ncbi:MAG: YbaK/EbsC family protein [Rhodobacteraceae bacterium]|nr:YbaK/EbsC family protein [Paracoccaceae bacterium]